MRLERTWAPGSPKQPAEQPYCFCRRRSTRRLVSVRETTSSNRVVVTPLLQTNGNRSSLLEILFDDTPERKRRHPHLKTTEPEPDTDVAKGVSVFLEQ